MIIYLITNKVNGKRYIGKTSRDLELRWKEHQRAAAKEDPDFYIARSIRYHGVDNFTVKMVQRCESEEALVEAEKAWIRDLGTHGPAGYNLTDGGEGLSGWVATEEARRNMSEAAKNRAPASEEHRKNISIANSGENNAFYGKAWGRTGPLSDEAKKKISIARTGKKLSEEHKIKIGLGGLGRLGPNRGKKFNDLTKAKMGLSRKFPVDVFIDNEHVCTCFSLDDVCELFKPSRMSIRKMRRMIRAKQSVGSYTFVQKDKCIAMLRLESKKT